MTMLHMHSVVNSDPYALITEDDVMFEMDVDFLSLAQSAPKGFGALQLMTSNPYPIDNLWKDYKTKKIDENSNGRNKVKPNVKISLWDLRPYSSQAW